MRNLRPILIVEDDRIDALTVKRALEESNVANQLIIATNGEEALSYLRDPEKEKPCIILLDLNMPKMNGIELLRIVKHDDILRVIPTVVLTTSREEQDKVDSFNLGVAGYMFKPVDFQKFVTVVKTIDLYWTLSELPNMEYILSNKKK